LPPKKYHPPIFENIKCADSPTAENVIDDPPAKVIGERIPLPPYATMII
jgi:hypothetical protein